MQSLRRARPSLCPLATSIAFTCWQLRRTEIKKQPSKSPTRKLNLTSRTGADSLASGTTGSGLTFEIAQVMGHESAVWLERPERDTEEHAEDLVGQLKLKPGEIVADIGAGTGY